MRDWSLSVFTAVLCVAASCTNPASPDGQVRVAVAPATATFDAAAQTYRTTLDATITNGGPSALAYLPCEVGLERLADGTWEQVYEVVCALDGREVTTVAPGAQTNVRVPINGVPTRVGSPRGERGSVDGEYRLRLGLSCACTITAEDRVSAPFRLVVE